MINTDILYDKPTHFDKAAGPVKVFVNTAGYVQGQLVFTAEIMAGESKGKYTTVYAKNLKIFGGE